MQFSRFAVLAGFTSASKLLGQFCRFSHNFSTMKKKVLFLFDVDGTLTRPRQLITNDTKLFLDDLKKHVSLGIVGGSDMKKIAEQFGGYQVTSEYDYVFAENGLIGYKDGTLLPSQNILSHMGEDKLQTFINFCLRYMSEINLPAKRGNFIEFRTGLINISPIGRSCSQAEREAFEKYDKEHKVREKFVSALREKFADLGLIYAIGGQISFDCFPIGWDKRYCLSVIEKDGFNAIHFFGDKTFKGGNDYEIYNDPRTIGHNVTSPEDTKLVAEKVLSSL